MPRNLKQIGEILEEFLEEAAAAAEAAAVRDGDGSQGEPSTASVAGASSSSRRATATAPDTLASPAHRQRRKAPPLVRTFERWIGLEEEEEDDDDDDYDRDHQYGEGEDDDGLLPPLSLEDLCPVPSSLLQKLRELLVRAYDGKGEGENGPASVLEINNTDHREVGTGMPLLALQSISPSVQATRWFEHLLDLTLRPSCGACELLLLEEEEGETLLKALYRHVRDDLPLLQSAVHLAARRMPPPSLSLSSSSTTTGIPASDVEERLEKHRIIREQAQEVQREWEGHIRRLGRIMGSAYREASAPLRSLQRRLLASVWDTFLARQSQPAFTALVMTPLSSWAGSGGGAGGVGGGAHLAQHQEDTSAAAVPLTLELLHRILAGAAANANADGKKPANDRWSPAYRHLLFHHLLSLHKPNRLVLWRDQTPLLELYHEPLVKCAAAILQVRPRWIPAFLRGLCSNAEIFPIAGHTPKQVLLIHEVDSYLSLMPTDDEGRISSSEIAVEDEGDEDDRGWWTVLLETLGRCMGSEHSRVAERALEVFRNPRFSALIRQSLDLSLTLLLPCLVRVGGGGGVNGGAAGCPSWNPTVRKRTYFVLKQLLGMDAVVMESVCNRLFGADQIKNNDNDHNGHSMNREFRRASSSSSITMDSLRKGPMKMPESLSLRAGMGSWRPPPAAQHPHRHHQQLEPKQDEHLKMPPPKPLGSDSHQQQQPPSTITGVAPWATASPGLLRNRGERRQPKPRATVTASAVTPRAAVPTPVSYSGQQPPVTVTGVAPWALSAPPAPVATRADSGGIGNAPSSIERNHLRLNESDSKPSSTSGYDRFLAYMKLLEPPDADLLAGDGISLWSKAQMSQTPTLLPDLKFHDLVFGHDLGKGAFGCVRYARLIDRSKTRSGWAEYAVKIISTEKIREMGYESSVQREIAVLRILSHPCIARLVSSFQFRDGAYLVLEYASGGDLHQLLRRHGSLDHDSTRFVVGETVAALSSIHDLGLVYGDLKTENILITETGHIKLTDMGACRPATAEARALMRAIAKDLLKNLRDGDWRPRKRQQQQQDDMEDGDKDREGGEDDEVEDTRIEGTTSYLPPEVVAGGVPTYASDSWALGCVTYQCLSGRPPFLDIDDESTRHRIVTFHSESGPAASSSSPSNNPVDALFEDRYAAGIEPLARDMIRRLLEPSPSDRPGMTQVAALPFFSDAGVDPYLLHRGPAHPLDVGSAKAGPSDAPWSRRQYSSIWAPQPEAYDLSLSLPTSLDSPSGSSLRAGDGPNSTSTAAFKVKEQRQQQQQLPIREGDEGPSFFSAAASSEAVTAGGGTGGPRRNRSRPIIPPTKYPLGRIEER